MGNAPEFWDRLWRREAEFMESVAPSFRHGTGMVSVSSIAEQSYCEYKVENELVLGEVPTEVKEAGSLLHEQLIPTERVEGSEFVELVTGPGPSLGVPGLWGELGGIRVVGVPDGVLWSQGRPQWVIELKTTRGNPADVWPDQENQVRVYGLLLDLMGFDCSGLRLALVRLRADELAEGEKAKWSERVTVALTANEMAELEKTTGGKMAFHIFEHDRALASKVVVEAAGYWLGKRDPTSSNSVGKCRACEFNSVCSKSLTKRAPDGEGKG